MIFVALGTHELPFTRLLKNIEALKREGFLDDEIIVQSGHTPFESDVLTIKPFVTMDEMNQLFEDADIVITHAGAGSMVTALKMGKKVIGTARLKKYNEHNDDHQLELLDEFQKAGYILAWGENDNLKEIIQKIRVFKPKEFVSGTQNIINLITDFIETK